MLSLSHTRVLPVLIPQSVNPQLAIDQYLVVQNTIQEMFDHIDRWSSMIMMMIMKTPTTIINNFADTNGAS